MKIKTFQAELYGLSNDVNSYGNETDDEVKQRYFYSMGELAVGGRCKCNGHASRCIFDKMGRVSTHLVINTFLIFLAHYSCTRTCFFFSVHL